MHYDETIFGFEYGDAKIKRLCSDDTKGWVTIGIETSKHIGSKSVQVYVTKTGKIRIHSMGVEWLPSKKIDRT